MNTLSLDRSHSNDSLSVDLQRALRGLLPDAATIVAREQKIGKFAGDDLCWVRSPGMCNTDNDNHLIAVKIMNGDLVIYLTSVAFEGYSIELKRMVDHQIQNISPSSKSINGETHQPKDHPPLRCQPILHAERAYTTTLSLGDTP